MKKILLLISFFFIATGLSFAQELNPSTEKRINLITRVMAAELGLNESEYLRLKALNRERILKADEIAELYAADAALMTQKLQQLERSFDQKFKAMLSPTQLAAYAAYQQSPAAELALTDAGNPARTSQKKE